MDVMACHIKNTISNGPMDVYEVNGSILLCTVHHGILCDRQKAHETSGLVLQDRTDHGSRKVVSNRLKLQVCQVWYVSGCKALRSATASTLALLPT